jgi:hypothetical protein
MITVYGRNQDRYRPSRTPPTAGERAITFEPVPGAVAWRIEQPGVAIQGNKLGEVLANFGAISNVRVIPHDPPKYFRYSEPSDSAEDKYWLVDIHVSRDGKEICPKQDLTFPLQPGDVVEILQLIC